MATAILGFLIMLLAMGGLAIGVLAGRAPLRGSCGGISCGACGNCPRRSAAHEE